MIGGISQELKECDNKEDSSGVTASLIDPDDLTHWKGMIKGPVPLASPKSKDAKLHEWDRRRAVHTMVACS